jgi:hypothetical protein
MYSPPIEYAHFEIPGRTVPETSLDEGPPVSSSGGGASGNETYLPSVYATAP